MLFHLESVQSTPCYSVSILLISFPYRFISTLLISTSLQRISIPFQLQSFRSGQFLFFTCHYCSKSRHIQSIPFLVIYRLIFSLSSQLFPLHSFSVHSLALLFLLRAHLLLSTPFPLSAWLFFSVSKLVSSSHSLPYHSVSEQINYFPCYSFAHLFMSFPYPLIFKDFVFKAAFA